MDKQELIEKLREHGAWCTECHDINGKKDRYVKSAKVRELLEQLDEPQKVKVPAFVAEWIELCKEKADLSSCVNGYYEIGDGTIVRPRGFSEEFYDWLSDYDHMHDLARAYLDGYEVEKEQKYYVNIGDLYLKEPLGDTSDFTISMTWNREYAYPFDSWNMAREHASKLGGTVEKVEVR